MRVRGTKSISLPSEPALYIDGVKVNNAEDRAFFIGGAGINRISDLNPNEIDRIEVVRGAAAATLYGTQGSNGVIQIFTKRGRTGAPEWVFETEGGFERSPTNRFPGRLWTQFTGPAGYRAPSTGVQVWACDVPERVIGALRRPHRYTPGHGL
jgi:TonB-dependent SusC/RagA subfamily outer membrane receptor